MTAQLRIPKELDNVVPVYVPPQETFKVFSGDQVRDLPATEWLLHQVLPKKGMSILYGASRHGKTLVAVMWAMELARKQVSPSWSGHPRSERGPFNVLYLCGEGGSQFNARLEAWKDSYAKDFENTWERLHIVLQPVKLFQENAKEWPEIVDLESTVDDLNIDVVFVDTLHSMTAGMEENSAKDMGKVMETLRKIVNKGKSVVLVHHTRKGDDDLRGSSSLEAGVDQMILCKANTKDGNLIDMEVSNPKNKLGKPWDPKYYLPVEWEGKFTEFDEFPANAVTLMEAEKPEGTRSEDTIRADIIAAVEERNPTYTELTKLVQAKDTLVIAVRKQLEEENVIMRNSDKRLVVGPNVQVEKL